MKPCLRIAIALLVSLHSARAISAANDSCPSVYVDQVPKNLQHATLTEISGLFVVNQVCQRLFTVSDDGSFKPELVETWSFHQGGAELRLRLKSGIRFSDGDALTTAHVMQMFKDVLAGGLVHGLKNIEGSDSEKAGAQQSLLGVEVKSEQDLVVRFRKPYYEILNDLSDLHTSICRSANGYPTGTGDYKLEPADASAHRLTFTTNPHATRPMANSLKRFCVVDDRKTPSLFLSVAQEQHPDGLGFGSSFYQAETKFLGFNIGHDEVMAVEVRRAVARAVQQALAERGNLPYHLGGYIPIGLAGHDPKLAPPTEGAVLYPKELTIAIYRDEFRDLADRVCVNLQRHAVNCGVDMVKFDELIARKNANRLSVFFGRFIPSSPSVLDLLSVFRSDSYFNYFLASSKSPLKQQLIDLYDATVAHQSSSYDKHIALAKEMDELLVRNLVVVPVGYGSMKFIGASHGVKLPSIGPMGAMALKVSEIQLGATE